MKKERIITAKQAKVLDKKALDRFGIPTILLMENAGSAISKEAIKALASRPGKVAVFCGTGNNGGDGFCAVRHFLAAGIRPQIYLAGKACDVGNEARINLDILLKLKQKIISVGLSNAGLVKNKVNRCSLIIDALLGVGAKGTVRPVYRSLIDIINSAKAYVISVDIPSGLDATTGKVLGCCVKADQTITFVAKKRGMIIKEGKKYCGKILISGIGVGL
ncbi:MAG: NAD(P)H-hydrate epimerase [Candidatus Omnitrophica bacterium]|nr:NAD(P)H-hydrate epimerase [Candidatus Omnitrophota bacterium]